MKISINVLIIILRIFGFISNFLKRVLFHYTAEWSICIVHIYVGSYTYNVDEGKALYDFSFIFKDRIVEIIFISI